MTTPIGASWRDLPWIRSEVPPAGSTQQRLDELIAAGRLDEPPRSPGTVLPKCLPAGRLEYGE